MTIIDMAAQLRRSIETPIDDPRKVELARLRKRVMASTYGISYKEAITLANEAEETIKNLPISDPALEYFVNQRHVMLQHATNIADSTNSKVHDHEALVRVLVEFDGITTEATLYVPRMNINGLRRRFGIEKEIRNRLRNNGLFSEAIGRGKTIDFIEL